MRELDGDLAIGIIRAALARYTKNGKPPIASAAVNTCRMTAPPFLARMDLEWFYADGRSLAG
jgi:hypothetical protein